MYKITNLSSRLTGDSTHPVNEDKVGATYKK